MRFHHSTRRGRHHSAPSNSHHHQQQHASSSRWLQLSHCRETNIYFNRRLPVDYPAPAAIGDKDDELQTIGSVQSNHGHTAAANQTMAGCGQLQVQMQDQQRKQQQRRHADDSGGNNNMDLESLREKLIAQVQKHPFWSNKAAKRMQIRNVKRRNVYIYELESYCERRDLEWNFEPYRGGLSAGSVTPYRSYELPASRLPPPASLSQPATPINSSSNRFVWSAESGGAAGDGGQQEATGGANPVGRSYSNGTTQLLMGPPLSAATTISSSSRHRAAVALRRNKSGQPPVVVLEPVSARLEYLNPSPDYVWSVDVTGDGGGQQRRNLGTPSCVSKELPNSSFVKRCHGCQGKGKLKCNLCHGVGYEVCLACSGRGSTRSCSASSNGRAFSRSCDRSYSSSGGYNRGDSESYNDGGFGGGSSNVTDANSRNSRYANGADHSSGNSLGGGWSTESCGTCHGAGQKRCWVCAGKSYNNCHGCAGTGSLRCYLNLTVSWLSHCDDVIINNSDQIIPKDRLRLCSGLLLVDQVEDRLRPLNLAPADISTSCQQPIQQQQRPQPDVSCCRAEAEQLQLASKHLLDKHRSTYKGEKFLKQRHKVTQIECHIVRYEWKQRHGQFVIYGEERKVYIGKYPFKSFCNLI